MLCFFFFFYNLLIILKISSFGFKAYKQGWFIMFYLYIGLVSESQLPFLLVSLNSLRADSM